MADFSITFEAARGQAMVRAADAFLRALGGGAILLRLPVGLQPGNAELGLAPPLIEDVRLEPAVVRTIAAGPDAERMEVLLSAATVQRQVELRGSESADELFAAALGLVHAGKLLRIASVTSDTFAGTAYFYRVTVTP